jgi:hypothetical protein
MTYGEIKDIDELVSMLCMAAALERRTHPQHYLPTPSLECRLIGIILDTPLFSWELSAMLYVVYYLL